MQPPDKTFQTGLTRIRTAEVYRTGLKVADLIRAGVRFNYPICGDTIAKERARIEDQGDMIQTQLSDGIGSWNDAFPVSHKPEEAAMYVGSKTHRPVRVINRKRGVIFTWEPTSRRAEGE